MNVEALLTFGDICRAFPDQSFHRIRYVITTRKIEPAARFAVGALYAPDVIVKIRAELDAIDRRRGAVPA